MNTTSDEIVNSYNTETFRKLSEEIALRRILNVLEDPNISQDQALQRIRLIMAGSARNAPKTEGV